MKRIVKEASGLLDDLYNAHRFTRDTRTAWHLPKCLLVEDDENDIELSQVSLESLRICVTVARNREEAIAKLNETIGGNSRPFDMLFLDLKLNGLVQNGLDVMNYAKVNFPWVHIVLVSAYIDSTVLEAAQSNKPKGSSYMGFISKPLVKEDIQEICSKHHIPISNQSHL